MKAKWVLGMTLLLFCLQAKAQLQEQNDAYTIEESGYISVLTPISGGIALSANQGNDIFFLDEGKLQTLISAPGCGRNLRTNSSGELIAFKHIDSSGYQRPTVFNLSTNTISFLYEPTDICGQPSYAANGDVIFSVGNIVHIQRSTGVSETFDIGTYANIIALSPNGNLFAFNNDNDEIVVYDCTEKTSKIVSVPACFYPAWSADGRYLAFGAAPDLLYIYDIQLQQCLPPIHATSFRWHPTENRLLANQLTRNESELLDADIIEIRVPSMDIQNLTRSDERIETSPAYGFDGSVFYYSRTSNEVVRINPEGQTESIATINNIQQHFYNPLRSTMVNVTVPGSVPYVHQKYDTPSWHAGGGSCAPTTAIMAIAYYNRLPEWPVSVDHGYSWDPHVNSFGSYVADRYRFNEWYFSETADAYGTTAYGGYGYMWNTTYSPNSRMKNYMEKHYMTSNQFWTTSCSYAATTGEIDNGYVHPICCYLTAPGHLVLAIGYVQGKHTLIFNDPYGNKNTPGYPSYDGAGALYDWPGYNNGYENLDNAGTYGYIAWTVAARTQEPQYSDTIIDDNHYGHGFYMNNSTLGSHMRYFRDFNNGYNNHSWYTLSMATDPDICFTTWTPNLTQDGFYRVSTFIPVKGTSTPNAMYHIYHANGDSMVSVNQNTQGGQWVELGVYPFQSTLPGYVYLGDSTGVTGDSISFDAVRWSYIPKPISAFELSDTNICAGDTVDFHSSSVGYTSLGWDFDGGIIVTNQDTFCRVVFPTPGSYTIAHYAVGLNGTDTLELLNGVSAQAAPIALFEVNDTILLLSNPLLLCFNNSTNAVTYLWDFGDGSSSSDMNPYHLYSTEGTFTVRLSASSALCPQSTLEYPSPIIVVNDASIQSEDMPLVTLFPNPTNDMLSITPAPNTGEMSYFINDVLGQSMLQETPLARVGTKISVNQFEPGLYYLIIISQEGKTTIPFVRTAP